MKKVALFLFALVLLSACNFTEELHITENGSGKMSINFDGSSLMQMAGDKISEGSEKKMDSTIVFKEFLEEKKDSIALLSKEDQEKLKRLKNFSLHMLVDPEAQEMNFSLFSDFKNVSELGDMLSAFQDASSVQKPGGNDAGANKSPISAGGTEGTEVNYSFVKNRFSRNTKIIDQALFESSVDSLEQAKMFLGESTYTLKYHFPRKIKTISADKALFSQDGKSFTLEIGFLELLENPKVLDIEVELEK